MNALGTTWKKNLIILWISEFIVMAGMSASVPFLPLFIRELGIKETHQVAMWSGWVFSGPFLISFFFTPVWGALGDKYGRKPMILRAIIGLSVSLVLIGFSANVYQLLVFRVLQGMLSGFYPAALALAASQAPEGKTAYSLSFMQSSYTSGAIVGPLFGGILFDLIGFRWVFILTGIATGILAVFIYFFIHEVSRQENGGRNYGVFENIRYFIGDKYLLIFGLGLTLSALGESFVRPLFVLFVESLGLPKGQISTVSGILISITGISSAFSALYFGRKLTSRNMRKMLFIACVGTGIMNCVQGFTSQVAVLFPVRFILGLFYGLVIPIFFSSVMARTGDERKSGVMGISSSFQTIGNFAGPLAAGYLYTLIGFRGAFVTAGLIFIFLSSAIYLMRKGGSIVPEIQEPAD